ncbi:MAG: phosphoglucosamine mutase [Deltaproteobacteria bacterium]|nr:MAG: phosphoglucosamine mutase [Deltaproteobacteria bacterium]
MTIRFGTDGVRGPAGRFPLDAAGSFRIGRAVAAWIGAGHEVVLGRDTRESGPDIAEALTAGLVAGGARVLDAGVLPTAAVSCAVAARARRDPDAVGVMVTASHNPWRDNGIKVLDRGGGKLLDPAPLGRWLEDAPEPGGGTVEPLPDPLAPWLAALPSIDLSGLHILLDCAHGAAAGCAPDALRARGARLRLRGCAPDGRNINEGVGSLHPPADLGDADLAICLDGDADRVVLVDRRHGVLDGDDILWLLSRTIPGTVVGTVMTNGGLGAALGDRLVRTPVGDRFVAMAMQQHRALLGGEPSGHILLADGPPTACGLTTALRVLQASADDAGRPTLPLPVSGWTRWPQARHDLRRDVRQAPLPPSIAAARAATADGYRVLVRPSGTEPVVRIMVEGPDADRAARHCAHIAEELS